MLLKRKKLRAATARRSAGAAEIDYAEIPEPNMKLSRALLIVLLLHVVAVTGIIAFNAIKTRQSSFVPATSASSENTPFATPAPTINAKPLTSRAPIAQKQTAPADEAKTSPAAPKEDHGQPVSHVREKTPVASGKTYTVVKGDNPVKIAKKLKVSYDDLIALNHIEDPRKLKIGQKLLIPKTTKPGKAHK